MKKMKIFFICLTLFVFTKACPVGWVYGDDSYCYKVINNHKNINRDTASTYCNNFGGYLAAPKNAFLNNLILSMSIDSNYVWIGVRCTGSLVTDCEYDDGTRFTNESYYNFLPIDTHLESDQCTILDAVRFDDEPNSEWQSIRCTSSVLAYACQIPYKVIPTCPPEYSQNGDSCYKVISMAQTYDDAEALCSASCGYVATPRSTAENDYITSLVSNNSYTSDYVRLGISYYNKQYYDSNTGHSISYNNFGTYDPSVGNCVELSLNSGKWNSTNCNKLMKSVCQTVQKGYPCVTTTPTPTHICTSPFYFENNGTVSSPNYPNTYNGETCTYIIKVSEINPVQFVIKELNLTQGSRLEMYNDITDKLPYLTLYNSDGIIGKSIFLHNSVMKLVAKSPLGGNNLWSLSFDSYVTYIPEASPKGSGCNGSLYDEGSLSSPNYPNNYPYNTICSYHLYTDAGKRITLYKNDIRITIWDEIIVYDGQTINNQIIGRFSGHEPTFMPIVSTGNHMLVKFITDGKHTDSGFYLSFLSD